MLTTVERVQPSFLPVLPIRRQAIPHPTVTLRRATLQDAPLLASMGERIFLTSHRHAGDLEDLRSYTNRAFKLGQISDELLDPNTYFWFAQCRDTHGHRHISGMFRLRSTRPLPANVSGNRPIEIARFYIDDAWVGRGVSQPMMQHALDQAAQLGHDLCWLEVWEGNQRAIAFYEKWGFAAVSSHQYPFGKGHLGAMAMVKAV